MKNNHETIPNELFDWIENFPFHALNQAQQSLVLAHFSEEEYTSMHDAAFSLHQLLEQTHPKGKTKIKANVMAAFDEKYGKAQQQKPFWFRPVSYAQAAALALLLMSGLAFFHFHEKTPEIITRIEYHTDTLVVESTSAPQLVYDTVYLNEEARKERKKPVPSSIKTRADLPSREKNDELYISGPKDLESPANRHKRNSFSYDTLANKIGFVSM